MVAILKKILLIVKIIIPYLVNVLLFLYIFNLQAGSEYDLANTFFYLGIINIIYGLGVLFISTGPGNYQSLKPSMIVAEQSVKKFHRDQKIGIPTPAKTNSYLKLIYIIIGILFIIAAIIMITLN